VKVRQKKSGHFDKATFAENAASRYESAAFHYLQTGKSEEYIECVFSEEQACDAKTWLSDSFSKDPLKETKKRCNTYRKLYKDFCDIELGDTQKRETTLGWSCYQAISQLIDKLLINSHANSDNQGRLNKFCEESIELMRKAKNATWGNNEQKLKRNFQATIDALTDKKKSITQASKNKSPEDKVPEAAAEQPKKPSRRLPPKFQWKRKRSTDEAKQLKEPLKLRWKKKRKTHDVPAANTGDSIPKGKTAMGSAMPMLLFADGTVYDALAANTRDSITTKTAMGPRIKTVLPMLVFAYDKPVRVVSPANHSTSNDERKTNPASHQHQGQKKSRSISHLLKSLLENFQQGSLESYIKNNRLTLEDLKTVADMQSHNNRGGEPGNNNQEAKFSAALKRLIKVSHHKKQREEDEDFRSPHVGPSNP